MFKRWIKSTKEGPVAEPADPTPEAGYEASSSSSGRLGLRVLHEPSTEATTVVDIIFVHGLGGSAISTWTSAAASKTFWPTLLHEDDRLANARISTFGYDANFKNILGVKNALGIADFADQLLDGLDSHYGKYGNVGPPNPTELSKVSHGICGA
jgi:hypothetical protein